MEIRTLNSFFFFNSSGLFSAGGMGLWHGVQYYEEKKIDEDGFPLSWGQVSLSVSNSSNWNHFSSRDCFLWAEVILQMSETPKRGEEFLAQS